MPPIREQLKKAREQQDVSLEEIALKTNIKTEYLKSIEAGDLSRMPTLVHAKGFVKAYAQFLGLDGNALSQKMFEHHVIKETSSGKIKTNSSFKHKVSFKDVKKQIFSAIHFHQKKIFLFFFIIFSILFIFYLVKISITHFKNKKENQSIVKEEVLPAAIPAAKPVLIEETKAASNDKHLEYLIKDDFLNLNIKILSKVWLCVWVDGNVVFEGVLSAGKLETWKAKNNIRLKIGDAGALHLTLNDKELEPLGPSGQVIKNMVIRKDGIDLTL